MGNSSDDAKKAECAITADLNELDAVVHYLGIEDSFVTPLEAIKQREASALDSLNTADKTIIDLRGRLQKAEADAAEYQRDANQLRGMVECGLCADSGDMVPLKIDSESDDHAVGVVFYLSLPFGWSLVPTLEFNRLTGVDIETIALHEKIEAAERERDEARDLAGLAFDFADNASPVFTDESDIWLEVRARIGAIPWKGKRRWQKG